MLSQKLKEYRNKNGLTQQDLAERLFVSRSAVAKWEQGKGIPNKDTLKSLCQMFECTKDELLNEDEAVEIIENVEKSSKKKTVILCAISIVLCIGLAVAVVIASFIYHNGKIICTTKSPDERIVLTVYDKPQSSGDVERGLPLKFRASIKAPGLKKIVILSGCIGLTVQSMRWKNFTHTILTDGILNIPISKRTGALIYSLF